MGDDADLAAPDSTELADLFIDGADDVGGGGETDAFVAAALEQDVGVDADETAFGVDEGSAAVAGVDGGIGLDVNRGVVGAELTGDGADDAHGGGVFEAEGAAEGEDDLALRILSESPKVSVGSFEPGPLRMAMSVSRSSPTTSAVMSLPVGLSRLWPGEGRVLRGLRKADLNAAGAADNVGVGEDVVGGVDDDAGAAAAGGAEDVTGAFGGGAEAAGDDLDDGGVD